MINNNDTVLRQVRAVHQDAGCKTALTKSIAALG